jgi:riboflavin kinase/FMN adenylyltransferase
MLELSAETFFHSVIRQRLRAGGMVEGPNFCFGRNREGTTEILRRLCLQAQMVVEIAEPMQHQGEMISSSRIRDALQAGALEVANRNLGRRFRLSGTVGEGQKRGRTLGFPTANLVKIPTLVPKEGVYVAVAHIGQRPPSISVPIPLSPMRLKRSRCISSTSPRIYMDNI